jgi:hypothetical protein
MLGQKGGLYAHLNICVCMHVCLWLYKCVCFKIFNNPQPTHAHTWKSNNNYQHALMHANTHTHTHTYTFTQIHTHTHKHYLAQISSTYKVLSMHLFKSKLYTTTSSHLALHTHFYLAQISKHIERTICIPCTCLNANFIQPYPSTHLTLHFYLLPSTNFKGHTTYFLHTMHALA